MLHTPTPPTQDRRSQRSGNVESVVREETTVSQPPQSEVAGVPLKSGNRKNCVTPAIGLDGLSRQER